MSPHIGEVPSVASEQFIPCSLIWFLSQSPLHTSEKGFFLGALTIQKVSVLRRQVRDRRRAYGPWCLQASTPMTDREKKSEGWMSHPFSSQVSLFQVYTSLVMEPKHHFLELLSAPLPSSSMSALPSAGAPSHRNCSNSVQFQKALKLHELHFKCSVATSGLWWLDWTKQVLNIPITTESSIGHLQSTCAFSKYSVSAWMSFENIDISKSSQAIRRLLGCRGGGHGIVPSQCSELPRWNQKGDIHRRDNSV